MKYIQNTKKIVIEVCALGKLLQVIVKTTYCTKQAFLCFSCQNKAFHKNISSFIFKIRNLHFQQDFIVHILSIKKYLESILRILSEEYIYLQNALYQGGEKKRERK